MIILAFETSCDDTSIALFKDSKLLGMDTQSQIKIHNKTGGVVPEVAAREHANSIFDVLDRVFEIANNPPVSHPFDIPQGKGDRKKISLDDVNHIAVTAFPGLMPSLLTGLTVAKTLGEIHKIPVHEVDHIEAHIFANYLERNESDIEYPLVCLTVSGGHNEIYYMNSMFEREKVGATTDDAAGEAFDKVAKMMGLPYPGGPIISELADKYNGEEKKLFPRVWLDKSESMFSFSGLKSAVKREVDARGELTDNDKIEIAYEFQNAVIEVLSQKLIDTATRKSTNMTMLAGGVGANSLLREKIQTLADQNEYKFLYPTKLQYCMDNAAMIGILAYYKISKGEWS